ncbi:ubiquinol oxidase subunit II [Thalassolituus sp. LLYu03]|uniref:ubiquinol oxidase subunit II n=1 Tax=Thalassolituus sp. LLYu03 TaxID=3421656 RepID=UPI003D28C1A2
MLAVVLLSGCQGGILDPKGQIGVDEKNLILIATGLMLLVVIPVIVLTLVFAWKYRASNTSATYDPKWSHSTKIELVVWLIPCAIVIILGTITWVTTHTLDPYKPLEHEREPLEVEVVSLDWKWLFIYPQQHIATVNELVIPTGVPVSFRLTSESVMNSFFIPQLGSQIYTMAAMETKLHLIADVPGTYAGFSANYSGAGFSEMKFNTIATKDDAEFAAWVDQVKAADHRLDSEVYAQLAKPSEANPVAYFSDVQTGLFDQIVMKFMQHHGHSAMMDDSAMKAMPDHEGHEMPAHEGHEMPAHEGHEMPMPEGHDMFMHHEHEMPHAAAGE